MTMRKIKFRGKRTDTGEWVYGNLLQDSGLCFIVKNIEELREKPFNECLVNPDTVGQYTGRNDRNGKDVYEGDIALMDYSAFNTGKDGQTYAVVRWIDDRAAFMWDAGLNYYADMRNADNVGICGNIHDNPELLEDGK